MFKSYSNKQIVTENNKGSKRKPVKELKKWTKSKNNSKSS